MSKKEVEIWKDIPDYEGYYQASNLGRVRSLDRTITRIDGRTQKVNGIMLGYNYRGRDKSYAYVSLCKDCKYKSFDVHQLVAIVFLGHKPCGHRIVVDHIDGNKGNNNVSNLRLVTSRENTSAGYMAKKDSLTSIYTGVHYSKASRKWNASITYKGTVTSLGLYDKEYNAHKAYEEALSNIISNTFDANHYKPDFSSKHKGVYWSKKQKAWCAGIKVDGKPHYLGMFDSEIQAKDAYIVAANNVKLGTFDPNVYKPVYSSNYKGVCYRKDNGKWRAVLYHNNSKINIGCFSTELEAHNAYQNALKDITAQTTLANYK